MFNFLNPKAEPKAKEPVWITDMARLKIGTMPESLWRYLCAVEGRALTVEEQEEYLKMPFATEGEQFG
jgi:hypothetical protein